MMNAWRHNELTTVACTYCIYFAIVTKYKCVANRDPATHLTRLGSGTYRTDRLRSS